MPKASVNIVTVRDGGLDWQLNLFANQTFKDFEIIIVDALYNERAGFVQETSKKFRLDIKHFPVQQLDYITELTHATNRNLGVSKSNGEIIIFFDDYQMPSPNFVEEHVCRSGSKRMTVSSQLCYYFRDVDYSIWASPPKESFEHIDYRNPEDKLFIEQMDPRSFWTNNASANMSDLSAVGGFDERYNGGTGGEDGDIGARLAKTGCVLFYTAKCQTYHISHHHIKAIKVFDDIPSTVNKTKCIHDRSPFTCNQYQTGDYNLTESGSLYTNRKNKIKYYICKNCGCVGVIDSIEVFNYSESTHNIKATIFDEIDGCKTFEDFYVPKEILCPLVELYKGTHYKYYERRLLKSV